MTTITGRTRIFGILADPIHHVKTPQGFNAELARRGVDGVLVPFHVSPRDLSAAVTGLRTLRNLRGLIVTVPHKTAIVPLLDGVSEAARLIGAVNTVRRDADGRLFGEMLDGHGFVAGLRQAGADPAGLSAYLAGAGGAASAIAFALAAAGVSRLTVHNRSPGRVHDLFDRLRRLHPGLRLDLGTPDPTGHDLVVNATSLGLAAGDPLPLDAATLTPKQCVAEIIMQPEVTPLLAAAAERGCRTHPGLPMLTCQLGLMADFIGVSEPEDLPPRTTPEAIPA